LCFGFVVYFAGVFEYNEEAEGTEWWWKKEIVGGL
jgi:hypothetical protein